MSGSARSPSSRKRNDRRSLTTRCDTGSMSDLRDLTLDMRDFTEERDWEQFHDPKSLALALVGEVGELAELLQWVPADKAAALASEGLLHQRMAEELSDVLLYLVRLADVVGVDLGEAARQKLEAARSRFAVSEFRGSAPPKH